MGISIKQLEDQVNEALLKIEGLRAVREGKIEDVKKAKIHVLKEVYVFLKEANQVKKDAGDLSPELQRHLEDLKNSFYVALETITGASTREIEEVDLQPRKKGLWERLQDIGERVEKALEG